MTIDIDAIRYPYLFRAFRAINIDSGKENRMEPPREVYDVPASELSACAAAEAVLTTLDEADFHLLCCGDHDNVVRWVGSDPGRCVTHALLNSFFEEWAAHKPVTVIAEDNPPSNLPEGVSMASDRTDLKPLFEGMDQKVARAVIDAASEAIAKAPEGNDGAIISGTCSAFIIGTLYVLYQLHLDAGYSERDATDRATDFIQVAANMTAKKIGPPVVEH